MRFSGLGTPHCVDGVPEHPECSSQKSEVRGELASDMLHLFLYVHIMTANKIFASVHYLATQSSFTVVSSCQATNFLSVYKWYFLEPPDYFLTEKYLRMLKMSSFGKTKMLFISNSIMLPSLRVQNTTIYFSLSKRVDICTSEFQQMMLFLSILET